MHKLTVIFLLVFPYLTFGVLPVDSSGTAAPGKRLFIFTAGYRTPVYKNTVLNSGRGIYVEAGINPGSLLHKKSIIGFYGGWAWKDNLWSTAFNGQFVHDYKKAINTEQHFSGLDSMIINTSPQLFSEKKGSSATMPGCEMNSFHNYSTYYGIILQLPARHAPVIKLYRGSTRSHYQGSGNMITRQKDYNIIQLRRAMYGCEIMALNPLAGLWRKNMPAFVQNIGISIYYEYCDFYTSSLYFSDGDHETLIALKKFTTAGFLKKYKHENAFGFKLSYNLL